MAKRSAKSSTGGKSRAGNAPTRKGSARKPAARKSPKASPKAAQRKPAKAAKPAKPVARRSSAGKATTEMNTLTIAQQDGDIVCRMTVGGYHLADGVITISVDGQVGRR